MIDYMSNNIAPYNLLFRLLSIGLHSTSKCVQHDELSHLTKEEWIELMRLAKNHGVKYLLFEAIDNLPNTLHPPSELYLRW